MGIYAGYLARIGEPSQRIRSDGRGAHRGSGEDESIRHGLELEVSGQIVSIPSQLAEHREATGVQPDPADLARLGLLFEPALIFHLVDETCDRQNASTLIQIIPSQGVQFTPSGTRESRNNEERGQGGIDRLGDGDHGPDLVWSRHREMFLGRSGWTGIDGDVGPDEFPFPGLHE